MKKFNKLPREIENQVPGIREKWLNIGLSTEPANRALAEKGVDLAYSAAGLKPPPLKIWLRSPLEGAACAAYLHNTKQAGENVRFQIEKGTNMPAFNSILEQIEEQLFDYVNGRLQQFQIIERFGANLYSQIETTILKQKDAILSGFFDYEQTISYVSKAIDQQIGSDVWAQIMKFGPYRASHPGQTRAKDLAFFEIFQKLLHGKYELEGLELVARSADRWWSFENAVILTERPSRLRLNKAGLLHCEDGPALEYPDGFKIYAWHGYRLTTHLMIFLNKSRLTPELIDKQWDVEIRRIMLEAYGFESYLNQRPYTVLDEDQNLEQPRRLLEIQLGSETFNILDVYNGSLEQDGSRRRFFLGALSSATTAHEAVALSYGIDPEYYREGVRT